MKKSLFILLLFLLSTTTRAEDYGPQPPAGFFERVTSFFSAIKQSVTAKIAEIRAPQPPATLPTTQPTTTTATTAQPTAIAPTPVAATAIAPVETHQLSAAGRSVTINVPPTVSTLAALNLRNNIGTVKELATPAVSLRSKQPTPTAIAAQNQLPTIKPRPRYDAAKLPGELVLPEKEFKIRTVLAPLPPMTFEKSERLSRDTVSMVMSLAIWVQYPDKLTTRAMNELFALSQKTTSTLIREKSLAFVAWILDNDGIHSLSSLVFTRAYAASPANKESLSYDNAILSELSQSSRTAPVTKTFLTLEKKLPRNPELTAENSGFLSLLEAERAFDRKNFAQARKLALSVPAKTHWKDHARYLAATAILAESDKRANNETAGRELTQLFKTVEDSALFDLTAASLGRIHFLLGNYKASHSYLSQVSRDTNLFIDAAVDNAWALLRSGDRNHAVGNMFTLHTPYFEGAFMPGSYFLQSLGYQEICQFGDAMTAIKQYKMRYNGVFQKLTEFNAGGKKSDTQYYTELTAYLTHQDVSLPEIVLRELGRHPEFIKRQSALNQLAREGRKVSTAMNQWMEGTLTTMSGLYHHDMAQFMKKRALSLEEELKFLTANISLLEYEIYAGAGNNLALQGAQNFAVDEKRAAPNAKVEDGKEYWPYEDEIWEDELNNFRSKMVDACARAKQSS